jgi:hypothetical protein
MLVEVITNVLRAFGSKLRVHCAYFGKKLLNPPKSLLRKRSPYSNKSRAIRKKYIGVGYKDHGTMRNDAIDGSPHWKEVSSQNFEEHPPIRKEEITILKTNYWFFRRHPVNNQLE